MFELDVKRRFFNYNIADYDQLLRKICIHVSLVFFHELGHILVGIFHPAFFVYTIIGWKPIIPLNYLPSTLDWFLLFLGVPIFLQFIFLRYTNQSKYWFVWVLILHRVDLLFFLSPYSYYIGF